MIKDNHSPFYAFRYLVSLIGNQTSILNGMTTIYKYKKIIFYHALFLACSISLVHHTNAENALIFESVGLFTCIGVLLGFAITIYTFSHSIADSIREGIDNLHNRTSEQKAKMTNSMMSGFREMKHNIWLLFVALLIVAIFSVLKSVQNPFISDIDTYKIPEIIFIFIFFASMYTTYDLIATLFNLSETSLILGKYKPSKEEDKSDNKPQ